MIENYVLSILISEENLVNFKMCFQIDLVFWTFALNGICISETCSCALPSLGMKCQKLNATCFLHIVLRFKVFDRGWVLKI